MRRLSLQDLLQYTAVTHEGAQAYDYAASHPLVHLTFTFGSALFVDGFYETEPEQVRRFARALVEAARVEPRFPWQYGAWMRDPVEGKGNRVQGSLVPALLDALLDTTEHTEVYVERCLSHRPDDVIAFLAHFRDLGLGAPSPAARRGMARALTRFDEYQLLKYARSNAEIRLCDAILAVRAELAELGESGALALTVGRVLHAPTRERDALLARAAAREDGLVPLPLALARRELFRLGKEDLDRPGYARGVAEARVTWEQVVGRFGRSVRLPLAVRRALAHIVGWKLPAVYVPALWRLAHLPKLVVLEQGAALDAMLGDTAREAVAALRSALAQATAKRELTALEMLVHTERVVHQRDAVASLVTACLDTATSDAERHAWRTVQAAVALEHAIGPTLAELRTRLPAVRSAAHAADMLAHLELPGHALAALDLGADEAVVALLDEARALCRAVAELASNEHAQAFAQALAVHERRLASWHRLVGEVRPVVVMLTNGKVPPPAMLTQVDAALARMLEVSEDEPLATPTSGPPALREAVERLVRRHDKMTLLATQARRALADTVEARGELDEVRAHNRKVWAPLLETAGLLGDTALLRNARNIHAAGVSTEALCAAVEPRRFARVWPHQVYAGFLAEPELEPVFESIMQKMTAKLPAGRHLGLADASGSMGIAIGGPHSSVTCMDVAFCLTGLMSETSGLGASFSDGTWGWGCKYLAIAEREPGEGMLAFTRRPEVRAGMGGTHVFGAVIELIAWLERHDHVAPPECLWFFSDMQFHPAAASTDGLPETLVQRARALGLDTGRPPLELALAVYREHFQVDVDVVLWNLQAYAPVPVPADMPGVLLVSGFDANTLRLVETWRSGGALPSQTPGDACDAGGGTVEQNAEIVLDTIRAW